ncbi:serine/threonine-protein kinase haspin-like isoform X2 [Ornithodoros turicata]
MSVTVCRQNRNKENSGTTPVQWSPHFMSTPIPRQQCMPLQDQDHNPADTSKGCNLEDNSTLLKQKNARYKGKCDSNNKKCLNANQKVPSSFQSPAMNISAISKPCRPKRNEICNQPVQWPPQFMSTPIQTQQRMPLRDHNAQDTSISEIQCCKLSNKMQKTQVKNAPPQATVSLVTNSDEKDKMTTVPVMANPALSASKWITMRKRNKKSGSTFTLQTLLGNSRSISVTKDDDVLVADSLEELHCMDTLNSSKSVFTVSAEKTILSLGRIPGRRAEKVLVSDAASSTTPALDFHLVMPAEENTVHTLCNTTVLDARETLLRLCNQSAEATFQQVLKLRGSCCSKVGEGLYGEVFCCKGGVFKVVPVEGNTFVNGEKQKLMLEILPEVIISRELSSLASTANRSANFIHMRRVQLVEDQYHPALLKAWDAFNAKHKSENDRPDFFEESQKYVVFEFDNGGTCLENWKINRAQQAQSIFLQVACTLAAGEGALEFEHRDLHLGNILISKTSHKKKQYQFDRKTVLVNTAGLTVAVIDYTLSRMKKGGSIIFTDLSNDATLFTGEGDYQFQVYRLMRKSNKNNWESYNPYSNVLWLHYLIDKLLQHRTNVIDHNEVWQQLLSWSKLLLTCSSATDFVINHC